MARKIILDVDTGIDDALAILLALCSPELDVIGVTCVAGNVDLDQVVKNTLSVLELARSDVPVSAGARKPLVGSLTTATYFHGKNGIGNINLPGPSKRAISEDAATFLTRMAREHPNEVTLVAVGPLTNVALAVLRDRQFAMNLRNMVIMGGAVAHPGNAKGAAEANFRNDPEAAAAVVGSGASITLVDLGITSKTQLSMTRLEPAAQRPLRPAAKFALELLQFYGPMYVAAGAQGAVLHDPLAVGLTALPELATAVPLALEVETCGTYSRGTSIGSFDQTVSVVEAQDDHFDIVGVAPRSFNAAVPRDLDAPRFLDMFLTRLGLADA